MSIISSFRESARAAPLIKRIHSRDTGPVSLMEFCGGHTVAIFRSGIRSLLPDHIRMLSGPGCPVCVTSNTDLDRAAAIARLPNVILTTYGDMLKVPGSHESLAQVRAEGYQVEIVYSTLDALQLAERHPDHQIVFFAIGFETTAPPAAAAVLQAKKKGLKNFSLCSVMKLTIPGARALLNMGELRIHGVVGPGHVSTIIGAQAWRFLPDDFKIPVAVSGFEPLDILASIDALLAMIEKNMPDLVNFYSRIVKPDGNTKAWAAVNEVFETSATSWRGFGTIPDSGLTLRSEYQEFDATKRFVINLPESKEHTACRCGEVLRGVIEPPACILFGTVCTPEQPSGPCMVSSEGSCAAYYNYHRSSYASEQKTASP